MPQEKAEILPCEGLTRKKQRFVLRNVRTVHEEEPFDIVIENGFITELDVGGQEHSPIESR